ncbi:MAG: extracellular solute-binding protein [Acetatifactor sp.]|nr:extracellular solute-binding protein [Acetatifactor sp.]
MHLKKRLIAVTAVAAMAAALFYGSTLEPGEVEENPFAFFNRKETIYFWYTDEAMTDFVDSAAVTFGEREDVRVIPMLASDSEYLEAVNHASLYSEQMPDVYMLSHETLERAYLAGLAEEINDVENICNEANFPAAALSAVTYHNKTVAYPLFFETSVLVYNETYLAEWAAQSAQRELLGDGTEDGEPNENSMGIEIDEELLARKTEEFFLSSIPSTVDDICLIADSFDVPEGVEGVMKWDVSNIFYNYWIVGNYMIVGGEAGDDDTLVNIANQETIQCLEVYKALNQFFFIESDTVTYDSVIQDFLDGKLVYTIATTDVVEKLAQAKEDGSFAFDYGIAPMPDVSSELRSRSMSVTNCVAVNGYSSHKELANRFAAYLADECAGMLYERTGKVSANRNANTDNGALQILMQEYADSASLPKMLETGNYWLYLERLFARVWNGEDVTTLVQELDQQITFQLGAETLRQ